MAKIALINPSENFKDIYGRLSEEVTLSLPLGLCYLASSLKAVEHEVKIIDTPALNISNENAAYMALEWGAKYIGITSTTDTIFLAADIANAIRFHSKNTVVILGGSHLTALPGKTLEMFSGFDLGVIGEGEETLKELISALENKEDLSKVKGIIFRANGEIKITHPREFIQDIDSLPYPAWDLLPCLTKSYRPATISYKKLPSITLVTSRGCTGTCSFCDTKVFGAKHRVHSSRYVLDMIHRLKENYGIVDITFCDDDFTISKKRLIEICNGLKNKKYNISWGCMSRVDSVNYDTMKIMKDAGCWKICFGVESACDDILKQMNKRITVEQSKKILREAKCVGLEVGGFFILGFFGETKDTLKMTRDFILNSPLDIVSLTYFIPFPGSPAYSEVRKYGQFNEDWKSMKIFDKPQFIAKGLTEKDILDAQSEIYKKFYFRPKMFAKYALEIVKKPNYALRMIKSALNLTRFVFQDN